MRLFPDAIGVDQQRLRMKVQSLPDLGVFYIAFGSS